ncbi:hypothetical protein C8R43DRAFT_955151 [Mycena crocata]|nr:hypothetical protein C8R43DRAFT_955151 [Mycena crocata]
MCTLTAIVDSFQAEGELNAFQTRQKHLSVSELCPASVDFPPELEGQADREYQYAPSTNAGSEFSCNNCGVTDTMRWHWRNEGQAVCNFCGAKHGFHYGARSNSPIANNHHSFDPNKGIDNEDSDLNKSRRMLAYDTDCGSSNTSSPAYISTMAFPTKGSSTTHGLRDQCLTRHGLLDYPYLGLSDAQGDGRDAGAPLSGDDLNPTPDGKSMPKLAADAGEVEPETSPSVISHSCPLSLHLVHPAHPALSEKVYAQGSGIRGTLVGRCFFILALKSSKLEGATVWGGTRAGPGRHASRSHGAIYATRSQYDPPSVGHRALSEPEPSAALQLRRSVAGAHYRMGSRIPATWDSFLKLNAAACSELSRDF